MPKSSSTRQPRGEKKSLPSDDDFLVVGLGASAGGIQALKEFFTKVPKDSGIAYVVILHMSPEHESKLAEILQTATLIPVTQVRERIMVIARNQGRAVHHVTVHHLKDRLAVSLDLEVDRGLSLGQAHAIASELEASIRAEFGSDIEVETHIEPMQTVGIAGQDAPLELQTAIAAKLRGLVSSGGSIRDVHSIRVRETPHGLVVNFHCRADPSLSIEKVHAAVDDLERRLSAERRDVHRVIGHAEPPSSRPH